MIDALSRVNLNRFFGIRNGPRCGGVRAGAGSGSIFFIADSDRETSETWRNHFFGKSLFAKFRDFRA